MKKHFILLLLSGISFTVAQAQISQGGTPKSFEIEKIRSLNEVKFLVMPEFDVEAMLAEDKYNDQMKDHPWRFARKFEVDYNPDNSGTWEVLADGSRIWRLGIESKGALSINLIFSRYKLPGNATLFIYNKDRSSVLGAFTSRNNQENGKFATGLVRGDAIIVEYYEPADVKFRGEISIASINHGYRDITWIQEKGFGDAGYCNVNAVCPEGDPIRDQIRSVARILIDGSGWCTGTLINNTSEDETPYFLTANHCYGDAGTLVFYFNYESSTCSNPGSEPSYNSMVGAIDRATYETSDFWLVELDEAPPAGYNVYYTGWNRGSETVFAEKVWCIHHPSGDIKKISWANAGVTLSGYGEDTGVGDDHWRIGSWSDGTTTEGGSSGSSLLDSDLRIIGQLHGGAAACGNTDPDWYGRFYTSWTGGGTSATRLSDWLDPGSTGETVLDGLNSSGTVECDDFAIPFAEDFNSAAAPDCWQAFILNSTGETNPALFVVSSGSTPYCSPSEGSHMVEFNSYDCYYESEIRLVSPAISTIGSSDIALSFDWHRDDGYSERDDRMTAQYSLNGSTWYDLSTHSRYHETVYGWENVDIDLPSNADNQAELYIGFLFHSEYGNNCHLDNVIVSAGTVGNRNVLYSSEISVYPVPSEDGLINVETENTYELSVLDISGRLITGTVINSENSVVDLSDQGPGLYIFRFRNENESRSIKVSIK
ncbi:MAG: T9SS type A sorting domain-containing protein [Bacteroidales bacterium]|nr:T9SS type A sorting domain-containing protein [Bacteroidales bacterium]